MLKSNKTGLVGQPLHEQDIATRDSELVFVCPESLVLH